MFCGDNVDLPDHEFSIFLSEFQYSSSILTKNGATGKLKTHGPEGQRRPQSMTKRDPSTIILQWSHGAVSQLSKHGRCGTVYFQSTPLHVLIHAMELHFDDVTLFLQRRGVFLNQGHIAPFDPI